jgi:hypothetical protein
VRPAQPEPVSSVLDVIRTVSVQPRLVEKVYVGPDGPAEVRGAPALVGRSAAASDPVAAVGGADRRGVARAGCGGPRVHGPRPGEASVISAAFGVTDRTAAERALAALDGIGVRTASRIHRKISEKSEQVPHLRGKE